MERHSSLSRSQSRLVVASRCNAGDSLYAAFQTRFYNRDFLSGCTIAKHIEPSARIINPGRRPRNINVETKSLIEESDERGHPNSYLSKPTRNVKAKNREKHWIFVGLLEVISKPRPVGD